MFSYIMNFLPMFIMSAGLSLSIIFNADELREHRQTSQSIKNIEKSKLETPKIETSSIPKKNIETFTIVEKTEINNYDFSKLSDSLNYIIICVVVFFLIKYSFILLKSIFNKINIVKEERKTLKWIKEFNNKITNESMMISYADAIECQAMINSILLENNASVKLKALNQELINKKEIINNIINKKYTLN